MMSKLDEQAKRIARILASSDVKEDSLWKSSKTVKKYLQYLKENIEFPCIVTGIEDFPWEEKYVFGYGSKKEYERLKKNNPSYKDTFEIIRFKKDVDEQILVKVKRRSDNKEFVVELDWLKATDKKSKNYQLLDDYVVWYCQSPFILTR